VTINEVR
jgi:hypothetical protein